MTFSTSLNKIIFPEGNLLSHIPDSVKKIVVCNNKYIKINNTEKEGGGDINHCFNISVRHRIKDKSIEILCEKDLRDYVMNVE